MYRSPYLLVFSSLALALGLHAEPSPAPATPEPVVLGEEAPPRNLSLLDQAAPLSPLEAMNQAAQDANADFAAALAEAENAGVSEADRVRARVIRCLSTGDLPGLLDLIPELEGTADRWPLDSDEGFASRQEIEGFIQGLKAIRAVRSDDAAGFEEAAKACFWNSPQWAEILRIGELVQQRHNERRDADLAAKVVLPLDVPLALVGGAEGEARTLQQLLEGKRAVLLDFWASWCGPCMKLMPELKERAASLPARGVAVAAVNTDEEDPAGKAAGVRSEKGMESVTWLIEPKDAPYSKLLRIDSIPRVLLISPEGKVLFNGHPQDPKLEQALALVAVEAAQ